MNDKGKWATYWEEGKRRYFLASDDNTHDVYLYISGDFGDKVQQRKYAENIAKRLNFKGGRRCKQKQGLTR